MAKPPLIRPGAGRRAERGYALLLVLGLITLLGIMMMTVMEDGRREVRHALRRVAHAEARAAAESGVSIALMRLLAADPDERWVADGAQHTVSFGSAEMRIAVTPEDGKVDLNQASETLLAEVFTAAGLEFDEAQAMAGRVADWRDTDELVHLNGAERNVYLDAGLPPPRNGPFHGIQELLQVIGMTENLFACIADAVTVHSGKAGIDRRHAPALLRAAPGLPAAGPVTGGTPAKAAPSPLAFETLAGRAVSIRVETAPEGRHATAGLAAVTRLTEHPQTPYWVLDWRHVPGGHGTPASDCRRAGEAEE